jgi:CelD/BcsL family acetyltransferase involved in cellulose biosynthesis
MVADLSGGFEAYLANRRLAGQGDFLKDKRRRMKMLVRDHAPVELAFGADDPGALGYVLRLKKEQFARGGQHDIFACGWTEALLRRLLEHPDPDFGARIAVLRTGEAIVAAEIGLISGGAYHLWFPVYDPAFHRYSPGQLMTLETLKLLAARGVRTVDFGAGGEDYKRAFADPGEAVFEGQVLASPVRAAVASALGLKRQRRKLGRRIDRIVACEPKLAGRVIATSRYAGVVAARHKGLTAAAGVVGLGLTIGLLSE